MTASLRIEQLHLGYDTPKGLQTVLSGFDLQVPAGHIASLLGPSGCGKTSVLRAIAGFEPVRAGSIHLGERLLSGPQVHLPPEQLGRRGGGGGGGIRAIWRGGQGVERHGKACHARAWRTHWDEGF